MKISPINFLYKNYANTEVKKSVDNSLPSKNHEISYSHFQALKNISLFSLSFGKNSFFPVYAIDKVANAKKYEKRKDIETELNLDGVSVSRCLAGKLNKVGDYTFVSAKDAEKINEDGTTELNEDVIKKAAEVFRKHIYAIDEQGNVRKFNSRKEAEDELKLHGPSITHCLNGKVNKVGDYTFLRAKDAETVNEDGTTELNVDVIKKAVEVFKKYIYAIDMNGNVRKFNSRKEAEDELKLDGPSITHCLNGKVNKVGNYIFLRANDVEMTDEDGNTVLNTDLINNKIFGAKRKKIYAIDKDCNYRVFNSRKEAAETLNVDESSITHCLKGQVKHVGEYTFVRANEIEKENISKSEIDLEIKKVREKSDLKGKLFAINTQTGEKLTFKNGREAAKILNVDYSSVYKCLRGEMKTTHGYEFVSATAFDQAER